MSHVFATNYIRLDTHPWLDGLRGRGQVWQGVGPHQPVLVVATVTDDQEWAAYYQLPHLDADVVTVRDWGNKIPEWVARELFGNLPYTYRR